MYRDVNDAVQKPLHLLFYEVIFDKKRNTLNPQMTKSDLVPPNKTKSTTNDMHPIKREAIS